MSGFGAVLRRDLLGSSRAALPALTRWLALAGCGAAAVAGLGRIGPGLGGDLGHWFGYCVLGLMLLGLALALTQALGAFRAERSAGTLDLLLLAGLRPAALVTARATSGFLVLLSIPAAAVPGLLLFAFFRTPTLRATAAHALALTCFLAVVAALAVAISAWTERPGPAIAAGLMVLPGFAALSLHPDWGGSWSAVGLVPRLAEADGPVPSERLAVMVLAHALLVAGALWIARGGLERRPARAREEAPRRKRAPESCDERHPLSWLLARCSPAARPRLQLLGLGIALSPLAGLAAWELVTTGRVSLASEPQMLSAFGGGAAFFAVAAALAAGATQIAAHRERGAWDEVAASARDGEKLLNDLLAGTLRAAVVPYAAAAVLLFLAELARGLHPFEAMFVIPALGSSLLFAGAIGLAASACADRSATAVATAVLLLAGLPLLVVLLHEVGAGDLKQWLVGSLLLVGLASGLLAPILLRGLAPLAMLLTSSLKEWKRGGTPGPTRLLTRPALVLVPLALFTGLISGRTDDAWALAYGGLYSAAVHLFTLGEAREALKSAPLIAGFWWQGLFGLLVLAGTWRHRALWLGRAAR